MPPLFISLPVVASSNYLQEKDVPVSINDLDKHSLIGMRISSDHGTELPWEFLQAGKMVKYHPHSQFMINNHLRKQAALDGLGITWLARSSVEQELASAQLVELLAEFAITYDSFYLYYPSRKGHSNVFKLIIDLLKCE
ncbi:hypothetical protein A9G35_08565 [Gilliamella sp. Choc5-1]|uniref:LysR substrate-binding domain-containing protein n=1 Tax=Gilliamella sp. Choc5-1 TaxID=3120238 RepID=UPI00080ED6BC|nr:LysR substrate-binding domain-containing protein [Gilliamella apicola]OCG44279.1 hypothetical protein A9G35_08565 [Gilliamella apicola]